MSDPMQEIRNSFFIECDELLEALQDGLNSLSDGNADAETINVVFRAVHSIKGGAGAFGLDALVAFAHTFETALDEMRAGRLTAGAAEIRLFFSSADLLTDLVNASRQEAEVAEDKVAPVREALVALVGNDDTTEEEPEADFTPVTLDFDFDFGGEADAPSASVYRIEFAPAPELFESGNEPAFLLRSLAAIGDIEVRCDHPPLPDLENHSATSPILSWRIRLEADCTEDDIREVFEFVDGLCTLEIREESAGRAPNGDVPADEFVVSADTLQTQGTPEDSAEPTETAAVPAPDVTKAKESTPKPAINASVAAQAPTANTTVRVDLDRIDRLVNLVGELVINQAMLSQSIAEAGHGSNSTVASGLDEFLQLTRNIQESVMMIRAQPVKSLFQRMARIVRESSTAVGKDVRFETEGEDTEIDKTVIERLSDPLTHMIRNAVDHGLESTDMRVASGKSAEGVIRLTAAHRSGRVVIEISDDGGGINRPRVRQIAEEKGLIPKDQTLSDTEIDNLLFLPGFSTAKEVSNLSGRGVGMDVVRNAIVSLGGRISISSEAGKGTTFSISMPLTLAVLDGMVVRVADETLVVPLSSIAETLSLSDKDIKQLAPGRQLVQVREQFVPLLDLGAALGYRQPKSELGGSIVLLLSQEDGSRTALVVDGIEDQRQVVIKGLQDSYGHVPGVAAATILGDGQIALILDPSDLTGNSARRDASRNTLKEAV